MIELVIRLLLTLLLLPVLIVFGSGFSLIWAGYEGPCSEAHRERKEAEKVAKWMTAHPAESALVRREQQRRQREELEHRAKLEAEKKAAEQERRREAQAALEAVLARPVSAEKQKLLLEMTLPPRLADLERLAKDE